MNKRRTARASFYFYNTRAEVDRLVEVLKDIQRFLGRERHKSANRKKPCTVQIANPRK